MTALDRADSIVIAAVGNFCWLSGVVLHFGYREAAGGLCGPCASAYDSCDDCSSSTFNISHCDSLEIAEKFVRVLLQDKE